MSNPFMPGNGLELRYLARRDEYVKLFTKSLKSFESGLPRNTVVSGLRKGYRLVSEFLLDTARRRLEDFQK